MCVCVVTRSHWISIDGVFRRETCLPFKYYIQMWLFDQKDTYYGLPSNQCFIPLLYNYSCQSYEKLVYQNDLSKTADCSLAYLSSFVIMRGVFNELETANFILLLSIHCSCHCSGHWLFLIKNGQKSN